MKADRVVRDQPHNRTGCPWYCDCCNMTQARYGKGKHAHCDPKHLRRDGLGVSCYCDKFGREARDD